MFGRFLHSSVSQILQHVPQRWGSRKCSGLRMFRIVEHWHIWGEMMPLKQDCILRKQFSAGKWLPLSVSNGKWQRWQKLWHVPIGPWTGRNSHPTCSVSPKFHKRSDSAVALEVPRHHWSTRWHLPCHTKLQTLHWPTLTTFWEFSFDPGGLRMFVPPFAQQIVLSVIPVHLVAMHRKTPVPRRAEAFVAQASRYQPSACTHRMAARVQHHRTQCMSTLWHLPRLFDHPSTTCAKDCNLM